jgi:PAS domain S-box-containing protein
MNGLNQVLLVDWGDDGSSALRRLIRHATVTELAAVDFEPPATQADLEMLSEFDVCLVQGAEAGLEWVGRFRYFGVDVPVVVTEPTISSHEAMLEAGVAGYLSSDEMTPATFERSIGRVLERFRIEEKLRSREERSHLALKSSGLGVWEYDIVREERRWDRQTRQVFGIHEDNPMPDDLWNELCVPEDRERVDKVFAALCDPSSEDEATIEARIVRHDGALRWIRSSGRAFFRGEGEYRRCVRLVGTVEDITDLKRAKDADRLLADAGARFATSLDVRKTVTAVANLGAEWVADVCVIDILDQDGELKQVQVTARSAEFEDIARWMRDNPVTEQAGTTSAQAIASLQPAFVPVVEQSHLERLGITGRPQAMLGKRSPISVMTLPIVGRNGPLGAILFLRAGSRSAYDEYDLALAKELTERAALAIENALLHEEAQRALSMRDELQRIVAHDLRDPLNAISLSANFVGRQLAEDGRESLHRALGNQRKAITAMKGLITDLLCAATLESGRLTIERETVGCRELTAELVEAYTLSARSESVELGADVPNDLPPVSADTARVHQIFGNLIGNALRHTPAGGHVELRARLEGDMIEFSVSDTGPGISPEDQQRLFERFWKTAGGGAGLGLWIAHELVALHGGTIWVSSTLGEGTTFQFTLPIAEDDHLAGVNSHSDV